MGPINLHADTIIAVVSMMLETYLAERGKEMDTDSFKALRVAIDAVFQDINKKRIIPGLTAPAVPVEESVFDDRLVCLEDGKEFKSLTRHLRACHNLSPDDYRKRWDLPSDYPVTAKNYSEKRSEMAKDFGLGRKRSGSKTIT